MDLLDFYRGGLTLRRVCLLVRHLPPDAAVWRVLNPEAAGWSRAEALTAAVERRVTALWATVTAALGGTVDPAQLAPPWHSSTPDSPSGGETEQATTPLRDIARMMREGV
ncbi:hypothetical protein [Kutzneria sp. NPDC052558]|uniref:hypothetical protein n=1 Tax=Kutzneria sp. NPDC052558 TaxID=3364121 RepID=UPI0037CAF974